MPQNIVFLKGGVNRNLAAPKVIKPSPGTVIAVICLAAGTLDLINDVTTGGSGASISGFPATMVKGQRLPLNSSAAVGITAKTVSGGGVFNVVIS